MEDKKRKKDDKRKREASQKVGVFRMTCKPLFCGTTMIIYNLMSFEIPGQHWPLHSKSFSYWLFSAFSVDKLCFLVHFTVHRFKLPLLSVLCFVFPFLGHRTKKQR